MQWILLILGVILAVVAVFALQNPDVVNIRFLNLSVEASVLVVILIAYAVGVLSGVLALVPSSVRKSARLRKLRSEVKTLEKQTGAEPAKTKAEKVSPDQRRFREVEAESARTPEIDRQPQAQPPAVQPPALGAAAPFASSTGSADDGPFISPAETAGSSPPVGSSPDSQTPLEGAGSSPTPDPDPDAEPPAGERRGWRRFLDL